MVSGMGRPEIESGFSLVELMISLVLGLILTLGVTQIYLSSSDTYRLTDGLARIQENARFASEFLGREIREAGGDGCLIDGGTLTDIRDNPDDPNTTGILGWEFNGTEPGDSYTIPFSGSDDLDEHIPDNDSQWTNGSADDLSTELNSVEGNVVEGSDILYMEGARSHDLNGESVTNLGGSSINLSGNSGIERDIAMQITSADCTESRIFYKNNAANASSIVAGGSDNQTGGSVPDITDPPMSDDLTVTIFRASAFYVGKGADGAPALFVQNLEGPSGANTQELLSNVENMQVLYGTGDAEGADDYESAGDVGNWDDVVSVRLALLMRSDENAAEDEKTRSFNLLGAEIDTPSDDRVRLVMMKTVGLRNRLE